ncbi:MAG: zinc metallopeptidase [Planctomycetes bacterium]|nr:zinc metallopeptidase [Planctomycetota bacterium]
MVWWDPRYFLFVGPAVLLAIYASFKVKSTFARAKEMMTRRGWTGRDVAQAILDSEGIHDVAIEPVNSYLGDHYDPRHRVLRLSPDVYHGRSIAAAGVAAHEVGHAIQHAQGYAALSLRNSIVPLASIGSNLSLILIMIGLAMTLQPLAILGCALFTMVVLFQVINLPVEFNASTRARQALLANGLVTEVEDKEVGRVLRAAAMTYVAATLTAILTLLYYLWRAGLLGGHRDE